MKNVPPVSILAFPAVIGRERMASIRSNCLWKRTLLGRLFSICKKCTNFIEPNDGFKPLFWGFRNEFANTVLKTFQNFWTKFIPETGTS
jgi:hypothetical protein